MSTSEPVSIITSAAYVGSELAAEFGHLPPAFLPFGHQRLFEAQAAMLRALPGAVKMTVPASFAPSVWDRQVLARDGIELIAVPDGLSLGASVAFALSLGDFAGPVRLLHGDTLFLDAPDPAPDRLGVSPRPDVYEWGTARPGGALLDRGRTGLPPAGEEVLNGWFAFSSASLLLRSLVRAQGDFLAGLDLYAAARPLEQVDLPGWLDFGHLQTYHRSRARISTARSFNALSVARKSIEKTGSNPGKLAAEAAWFEEIPPDLRLHTPPYLGRTPGGYRLGYENSPTLHELFVFGSLESAAWDRIAHGIFDVLDRCRQGADAASAGGDPMAELAVDKTRARLATWAAHNGEELDAAWHYDGRPVGTLGEIAERTAAIIAASTPAPGIMHGDLCFSNMFFDSRNDLIKLIDPRGFVRDGEPTVFGDLRYDLAKLNHSVQGYDMILAGRYELVERDTRDVALRIPEDGAAGFLPDLMRTLEVNGYTIASRPILALTIHLFLSMLPLHQDRPDRQRAFVANALRLTAMLGAEQ